MLPFVSIPGWLDRLVSVEDVELPARGVVLIWECPLEDDVPVDCEGCCAISAMAPPANIKTPSPTLILMNPPWKTSFRGPGASAFDDQSAASFSSCNRRAPCQEPRSGEREDDQRLPGCRSGVQPRGVVGRGAGPAR